MKLNLAASHDLYLNEDHHANKIFYQQATTPVAVLFATWGMGMAPVNYKVLMNVSAIVLGVVIASFGEIQFQLIGFLFQLGGIVFEAGGTATRSRASPISLFSPHVTDERIGRVV